MPGPPRPVFLLTQGAAEPPGGVAIGVSTEKARERGDGLVMTLPIGAGHAEIEMDIAQRRVEPQRRLETRDGRFETTLLAQGVAQIHHELRLPRA